ncbi:Calcium-transporting ATPase 3 [Smittium culicis]|uniref:P-type Na(+) transporter n=1 Tax=Smittium culicis TaxID=133412 RepID=A0A1R1X228_9FUNG|nr:Calcium-transporting ATPase 3 [Smittium culicis]
MTEKLDSISTDHQLFHILSVDETVNLLETNTSNGLSQEEVDKRLLIYGNNELTGEGGVSPIKIIIRQFTNIMVFILFGAAILSFAVKDFAEAGVVLAIIFLNATVGFFQEYKAEKTVDSLRKMTSPTTNALRDGHLVMVPTLSLVPGDIIYFKSGDVVGADCRLFDVLNFETDEALLTGEALPVLKEIETIPDPDRPLGDRLNIGYASTIVSKGRAKAIVTYTGMKTEVGKIAKKLMESDTSEKTKLNKSLDNMSWICLGIAIFLVLVVFAANKFKINGEVLIYSVSLAIAVIPEGLLAVLTLTMAMGVRQMSKQKALVRQLNALETLGSVTDICSDKTGTLTQAKMVLVRAWIPGEGDYNITGLGFKPFGDVRKSVGANSDTSSTKSAILSSDDFTESFNHIAKISALCNMAEIKMDAETGEWFGLGDPTEIALQVFSNKVGFGKQFYENSKSKWKTQCEFSFDSSIKRMTVICKDVDSNLVAFLKGATEKVVECCNRVLINGTVTEIDPIDLFKLVEPQIESLASDGLRVISLAYRDIAPGEYEGSSDKWDRAVAEKNMIYIGLVGIYDPPRPESRISVEKCFRAGIMVHMLTGDHPATATSIAKQVGIIPSDDILLNCDNGEDSVTISSLVMTATQFDVLTDEEIDSMKELPSVIARCTPDTKVKLIEALHRRNGVVAMTGDGVNDSPSLKISDVGIAMGMTGSDVAKQASSIILTDDNFSTIVRAVAEGRRLFTNISKFIRCLTGANVAELVCLVVGLAFPDASGRSVFPLSPVAILTNNLITGTPPAMSLGTEKAPEDNMDNPPRDPKKGLFVNEVIVDILFHGIFIGLLSILSFYLVLSVFGNNDRGENCNSTFNPSCEYVFKARGTNFAVLTILLMFFSYSCRDPRRQTLSPNKLKNVYENKYLFYSFWAGIAVTFIALYVPGLNTNVFKHSPITWEWSIVAISIVIYLAADAAYKYGKSFIFKPAYLNDEKQLNLQRIATKMTMDK